MKRQAFAAVLGPILMLLLASPTILSEEGQVKQSVAVSDTVQKKLESLFQKHYPKATFTNKEINGIHFEHEVTVFEFPHVGTNPKGGKQEAEKQRGPKAGGILCSVYATPGPYRGQLALGPPKPNYVPHHLRDRQKYKQLLMAPYSPKSDAHMWVALSHPPDADEKFVEGFRQIMLDFQASSE